MEVYSINVNVIFENISADRHSSVGEPIKLENVETNMNTSGINRRDNNTIEIKFNTRFSYRPALGEIELRGRVIAKGDENEIDNIEQKDREETEVILNTISRNCVKQATKISEIINIPMPMTVPQISLDENNEREKVGREYG